MADHKLILKKAPKHRSSHFDSIESETKPRPFKFFFPFELLPEGEEWHTGDKYRITIEGEQTAQNDHKAGDEIEGGIEISVEKIGGEAIKGSSKRFSRIKNSK